MPVPGFEEALEAAGAQAAGLFPGPTAQGAVPSHIQFQSDGEEDEEGSLLGSEESLGPVEDKGAEYEEDEEAGSISDVVSLDESEDRSGEPLTIWHR